MKKTNTNQNIESNNTENNNVSSFLIISFLIGYIIITLLPKMKAINVMGIQWLFLGIVNILMGLALYFYRKDVFEWSKLKINSIFLFYFGFILFTGFSVLYAENKYEAIAGFVKMLTIFSGFVLLSIAANKKSSILLNFSIAVSILTFYEAIQLFFKIYSNFNSLPYSEIRSLMKGNYGNVNILASSLVLKFPFIIYAYLHFQSNKKYFFLVTYILSVFVFIPLTSRTNYINLIILLLSIIGFLLYSKELKKHQTKVMLIVLSSILAYIVHEQIFADKIKTQNTTVATNTAPTDNLNETSGNRFTLWNNAIQSSKESPILGYGVENYQIKTIPFESKQREAWRMSKFTHNDFIQVYAESGVLAVLFYVLLFVFGGIYVMKKVFDKNSSQNDKWIALIVLFSIIAYGLDSTLNFPLRVTISQVHFVILFFFLFTLLNSEEKQLKNIDSKYVLLSVLVLNFILLVPNYKYFYAQFGQNDAIADMNALKLSYNEVDKILPNYPVLTEMGFPVAVLKARYLEKERRFDEALDLLNKTKNHNKNVMFGEVTKASIFKKLNMKDSMFFYAKKSFEMYPKVESMYMSYIINLKNDNKLEELQEVKKYMDKYGSTKKFDSIYNFIYNFNGKIKTKSKTEEQTNTNFNLKDVLNNKPQNAKVTVQKPVEIKTTPEDKNAQKIKELAEKVNQTGKNWSQKLSYSLELDKLQPNNPVHTINIGMSYYKLSKFSQAKPYLEKSIQSNHFKDGLPEFVLACNYLAQKDKSNGCKYLEVAKSKGYTIPEIIAKNCN